jgi:ABC-type transport system involved in multi-copper enzyme maturation permease subunit
MYLWKCWRDTRAFCFIFAIIAAAVMPVAALICTGTQLVQNFGLEAFKATHSLILNILALGLGAICAINEFGDKTAHFLFTKPRTRAYFVWLAWLVGCIELLAIGLINLLAGWLTLSRYSKHAFHSGIFFPVGPGVLVGVFVYSIFVYSLTYALTAVLRSGLKGIGASMGFTIGMQAIAAVFRVRWNIDLPVPPAQIGNLPLVFSSAVWLIVTLGLVYACQWVIDRAEI